jgi:hypothetical protein
VSNIPAIPISDRLKGMCLCGSNAVWMFIDVTRFKVLRHNDLSSKTIC